MKIKRNEFLASFSCIRFGSIRVGFTVISKMLFNFGFDPVRVFSSLLRFSLFHFKVGLLFASFFAALYNWLILIDRIIIVISSSHILSSVLFLFIPYLIKLT